MSGAISFLPWLLLSPFSNLDAIRCTYFLNGRKSVSQKDYCRKEMNDKKERNLNRQCKQPLI